MDTERLFSSFEVSVGHAMTERTSVPHGRKWLRDVNNGLADWETNMTRVMRLGDKQTNICAPAKQDGGLSRSRAGGSHGLPGPIVMLRFEYAALPAFGGAPHF